MTAAWYASAKTGQQTLKVTHSCVESHRLEFQVCLFDLTCNVLHYSTEVLHAYGMALRKRADFIYRHAMDIFQ